MNVMIKAADSSVEVEDDNEEEEQLAAAAELAAALSDSQSAQEDSAESSSNHNLPTPASASMVTNNDSDHNSNNDDDDDTQQQVAQNHTLLEQALYHEGATPLFTAIEECNWHDALDILSNHPSYARTWIKKCTTSNNNSNHWRRLPLHEAARRQAPAWLMAKLLRSFPESAAQTAAPFHSLPLHLAVESGAPPEVVNLLLSHHWQGIGAEDQSGRTPLAIITSDNDENEQSLLVKDCLQQSQETYRHIQEQMQQVVLDLQRQHQTTILALKQQHALEQEGAREKQHDWEQSLESMKTQLQELQQQTRHNQSALDSQNTDVLFWQQRAKELQEKVAMLNVEKEEELKCVQDLCAELERRDDKILKLNRSVQVLREDMQATATTPFDALLANQVQQSKEQLEAFVRHQEALYQSLAGHGQDLHGLLAERGWDLPPSPPSPSNNHDEAVSPEQQRDDTQEAAQAAAQAALVALQQANEKQNDNDDDDDKYYVTSLSSP